MESEVATKPTPTESGHIEANGVNYYYEVHGNGELLLLLHGGLASINMFKPVLPMLTARMGGARLPMIRTRSRCDLSALNRDGASCRKVDFDSDDLSFAGTMRMTWTFEASEGGTRVTVSAENVPDGVRREDHQTGLTSTLDKIARFTEVH